jgi:putative flippase GtrA
MRFAFITDPRERTRFFRFAVVGAIGALVDFGVFNLFSGVFHLHHVFSSILSFSAAVISNFTWNRYWTYPDSRSKPISNQLFTFTIINIIGLGIRTPLFAFLSGPLTILFEVLNIPGLNRLPSERLGQNLSLAIAILVVMMWNYFINRYWTFNDVE